MTTKRNNTTTSSTEQPKKRPRMLSSSTLNFLAKYSSRGPRHYANIPDQNNKFLANINPDLLEFKILPFLDIDCLARRRSTCHFMQHLFLKLLKKQPTIHVPKNDVVILPADEDEDEDDAWHQNQGNTSAGQNHMPIEDDSPMTFSLIQPTIHKALRMAKFLSAQIKFTESSPLVITVGKGVHNCQTKILPVSVSTRWAPLVIPTNNITIVGVSSTKPNRTVIYGMLRVQNKSGITIKNCSFRNNVGGFHGVELKGHKAFVHLEKCIFKCCAGVGASVTEAGTLSANDCQFNKNEYSGVRIEGAGSSGKLTNCIFRENKCCPPDSAGVAVHDHGGVDLHGESTDVSSNQGCGLRVNHGGRINIHLPITHNTSHDHEWDEDDGNDNSYDNINEFDRPGTYDNEHSNTDVNNKGGVVCYVRSVWTSGFRRVVKSAVDKCAL